ncbi:hypothetical protein P7H46_00030 [Enterococcus pseudoavium]|uniref:Uncharacterized protein n=1 Tax=Enterococcus pseudoavium TaxID=44007 RepID=A0ABU3FDV5_9ENTE|nr:hypothetical protein [Enterococcus pseudoavium]MDT2755572.1 hypothetical protein [Enterococcus pseudoavium]MDT2769221.1 hypothetical protein [Enterococcus pseudoavium]REC31292.1 hypothetical protein CF160_02020 [Enterococcus pseudoavium]
MNDLFIWKKLNEQLDAEFIDQLDKNFIMQNTIYFESNFAKIRGLDSGFAFPPIKRKPVNKLDGLSYAGKSKYRDLERQFKK